MQRTVPTMKEIDNSDYLNVQLFLFFLSKCRVISLFQAHIEFAGVCKYEKIKIKYFEDRFIDVYFFGRVITNELTWL